MSRPIRIAATAVLALSAIALTGCRTLYSDVYSPKRNRYVALPEKRETVAETPTVLPETTPTPGMPSTPPPAGLPAPEAAPPAPAAPMIPGLEPLPG